MWVVVVLSSAIAFAHAPQVQRDDGREPGAPFRVIGNIYYVGSEALASYLITTPDGHILHDTGTLEMHDVIRANIEKLGFEVEDVKFMVSSHAHFDHIEGHAAMKRATGAQVVALGGDAEALESGRDNSAIGARELGSPFEVDRVDRGRRHGYAGRDDVARAFWTPGSHAGRYNVDDDRAGGRADV